MLSKKHIVALAEAKIGFLNALTSLVVAFTDLNTMGRNKAENHGKIFLMTVYTCSGVVLMLVLFGVIGGVRQ